MEEKRFSKDDTERQMEKKFGLRKKLRSSRGLWLCRPLPSTYFSICNFIVKSNFPAKCPTPTRPNSPTRTHQILIMMMMMRSILLLRWTLNRIANKMCGRRAKQHKSGHFNRLNDESMLIDQTIILIAFTLSVSLTPCISLPLSLPLCLSVCVLTVITEVNSWKCTLKTKLKAQKHHERVFLEIFGMQHKAHPSQFSIYASKSRRIQWKIRGIYKIPK